MKNANPKVLKTIKSITISRRLPVNLSPIHKPFFEKLETVVIDDINVLQFSKVNLTSQAPPFKRLVGAKGISLQNDNGEIVPYTTTDFLKIVFLWPHVLLSNTYTYLSIDNIYSHTYYHWLTEALPRLFLVKEWITTATLLLPSNHDQKFHKETLEIFNIQRIEWLKQKIRYTVPRLVTSTQIGRMANYNPEIIREMAAYMKSKIDPSINFGEKIFISRRDESKRKIVNQEVIIGYLESRGFKRVYFEDHSFAQQVSIMIHCKKLVGLHGAGLANMIFMEKGGFVLELRNEDGGENYFYYSLASAVNLEYFYQFCFPMDKKVTVKDADVVVDPDVLKKNIELMLSR